jgi:hypothetical protein
LPTLWQVVFSVTQGAASEEREQSSRQNPPKHCAVMAHWTDAVQAAPIALHGEHPSQRPSLGE